MKNDQWFEPGDKVMRVGSGNTPGAEIVPFEPKLKPSFNQVFCVSACWKGKLSNLVDFVGSDGPFFKGNLRVGWPARHFRKVDEIKLCIAAVKSHESTTETKSAIPSDNP